jgi:glycosyltransferase involved in cell wall biosynthesis
MEAMACGTPCVGFNVGGIPEMISHRQTGYVAEYRNADDLAAGIRYVLDEANTERLSQESLRKVREQYSEDVVASKYMELYNG